MENQNYSGLLKFERLLPPGSVGNRVSQTKIKVSTLAEFFCLFPFLGRFAFNRSKNCLCLIVSWFIGRFWISQNSHSFFSWQQITSLSFCSRKKKKKKYSSNIVWKFKCSCMMERPWENIIVYIAEDCSVAPALIATDDAKEFPKKPSTSWRSISSCTFKYTK